MPPKKVDSKENAINPAKIRDALRDAAKTKQPEQVAKSIFNLSEENALNLLFAAHFVAALYAPIQDCDEVYNYWEPTHYLNHGYGMQTWEYSPDYAIRSWFYAALHAIPIYLASFMPFVPSKSAEFYALRAILAFVCAQFETRLFKMLSQYMNPRIGFFFIIVMATSAGMFHASISYLPSSFAMYCVTYALSEFMNWRGRVRTASGLMWLAIGTIVGWPFVAILAVPFVIEEIAMSAISGDVIDMIRRMFNALIRSLFILSVVLIVDTFFYHKLTIVSYNIVRYNILSATQGKGPNIYGTESWDFYIRNLLINFNVFFPLALLAWPLLLFQHNIMGRSAGIGMTYLRSLLFISPFYIWLAIFESQPHKEERFMYPIYPCIAINAAISLHIITFNLSDSNPSHLIGKVPARLKLILITTFVLTASLLGIWRSAGLVTAYSAPLRIYGPLSSQNETLSSSSTSNGDIFVCLGKEWYRFPSSYHLPPNARLKYLRSEFHGLLPGAFSEASTGFGLYPGAWLVPSGMNDENREDLSKYIDDERRCHYIVDSWFPGTVATKEEPDRVNDQEKWEKVKCERFLDAERTGIIGRLFWVPDGEWIPKQFRRSWGEYCLLKRKDQSTPVS